MTFKRFPTVKGVLSGIKKLYADAAGRLSKDNEVYEGVMDALAAAIRKVTFRHYTDVIGFNDSQRRTIDSIRKVVDVAHKAA